MVVGKEGPTDGGGEINQFSRITNKASAVISFDELWEVRERSGGADSYG